MENNKPKIVWATPSSSLLNTLAVAAFSAIVGGLFFLIDVGLSYLMT